MHSYFTYLFSISVKTFVHNRSKLTGVSETMNTEHPRMFQHGDLVFAKVKGTSSVL